MLFTDSIWLKKKEKFNIMFTIYIKYNRLLYLFNTKFDATNYKIKLLVFLSLNSNNSNDIPYKMRIRFLDN